jgi:UDP-glucuronate decarboxylase
LKALVAVVAGGAGMIGSSLCETLLRKGNEVVCLDNLSTGRIGNVEPLFGNPRFHFIHHDVTCDLPDLPAPDRVFHLASPASPVGYSRLPIETMLANSEGTRRLIGLARGHGARFLFCSTSEVYGDPQVHPQTETYRGNVSPIGPRSTYDESKRYGEAMTMAYVRSYGLDGRIVRIFNTYGPYADAQDGRVVVNFIGQALRGEPMTIYGDGMQTRSLCYVADLVEGLIGVMEAERTRGEVVNLGNPDEHTVLEIAEIVRRLTHSTSRFIFTPPAVADDPRVRRPNIDKARSLVGWAPSTPLEVGLRVMIRAMGGEANGNGKAHDASAAHANGDMSNGHANGATMNGHANGATANGATAKGAAANGATANGDMANGHANGGMANGHANGHENGAASGESRNGAAFTHVPGSPGAGDPA